MKAMKVVILCGGYGTRIRDVADDIPKPLIPIGDAPILWHIMKYFSLWGLSEFILCLGYKGSQIKDFFINYQTRMNDFTITLGEEDKIEYHNKHDEASWKVTLIDTGIHSLTATRLRMVRDHVKNDDSFMLTYGDGVADIDIHALINYHNNHSGALTVSGVRPPGRFGEIELNATGDVLGFNEKPQATGGVISGGFFVCRQEVFDYLPDNENVMLEQQPIQGMTRDGKMKVYAHQGFWQCMDTQRDFNLLNDLVNTDQAPWMKW